MIPSQGTQHPVSQTAYMHRGTSPYTIWYAGCQNQTAFSTRALIVDTLTAYEIVLSRPVVLSKISFEITTSGGAGSKTRCGIYRATSLTNTYPSSLVVDGGEKDTTVAASVQTTASLSVAMPAGNYWLTFNCGTAAPTLRAIPAGGQSSLMGADASTLISLGGRITVASAYAALPATFPAGGAIPAGGNNHVIALELS